MISDLSAIELSRDTHADRASFQDWLSFSSADADRNGLIFPLSQRERACHLGAENVPYAFQAMCDEIAAEAKRLYESGLDEGLITAEGCVSVTNLRFAGSGSLSQRIPHHPISQESRSESSGNRG